jgi:hypothetical protein
MVERYSGAEYGGLSMPGYNGIQPAGYNALHLVAYFGDEETMPLLLEKEKVDIVAQIPTGETALHIASPHGHPEQVRLLLKHGQTLLEKGAIPRRIYDEYDDYKSDEPGLEKRWECHTEYGSYLE